MTQEVMAEKAGISVRFVQKIEAGDTLPSIVTLAQIREALGCSFEDLMRGV
jgi:transcriptional regulator with XRE-family HTH domain